MLEESIDKMDKKIKKQSQKIEETSFAYELLKDQRKTNKRQFIIILVILILWFITGIYLVYVLNDVGVIETTNQEVMQENESGDNNFIGNDGDIIYGKAKDKDN